MPGLATTLPESLDLGDRLELQKRGLEQYSLPADGWFKKRLLDTYETCNKVAASLPAEAVEAGEASLVPGLYR